MIIKIPGACLSTSWEGCQLCRTLDVKKNRWESAVEKCATWRMCGPGSYSQLLELSGQWQGGHFPSVKCVCAQWGVTSLFSPLPATLAMRPTGLVANSALQDRLPSHRSPRSLHCPEPHQIHGPSWWRKQRKACSYFGLHGGVTTTFHNPLYPPEPSPHVEESKQSYAERWCCSGVPAARLTSRVRVGVFCSKFRVKTFLWRLENRKETKWKEYTP